MLELGREGGGRGRDAALGEGAEGGRGRRGGGELGDLGEGFVDLGVEGGAAEAGLGAGDGEGAGGAEEVGREGAGAAGAAFELFVKSPRRRIWPSWL